MRGCDELAYLDCQYVYVSSCMYFLLVWELGLIVGCLVVMVEILL